MDVVNIMHALLSTIRNLWILTLPLYALLALPSNLMSSDKRKYYHLVLSTLFILAVAGWLFLAYYVSVLLILKRTGEKYTVAIASGIGLILIILWKCLLFFSIPVGIKSTGAIVLGVFFLRYIDYLRLRMKVPITQWLMYGMFFPVLMMGPFEHMDSIGFSRPSIFRGFKLLLRGIAAGMVYYGISAFIIPGLPSGILYYVLYTPLYGIEFFLMLYAAFSMIMAAGCFSGLPLRENFPSFPYGAESIREFWHRWNFTVTDFLRENIYIPLGGRRRFPISVMMTFIFSGLWHSLIYFYPGSPYSVLWFIVWGVYNGSLFLILDRINNYLPGGIRRYLMPLVITYAISLGWLFFGHSPW